MRRIFCRRPPAPRNGSPPAGLTSPGATRARIRVYRRSDEVDANGYRTGPWKHVRADGGWFCCKRTGAYGAEAYEAVQAQGQGAGRADPALRAAADGRLAARRRHALFLSSVGQRCGIPSRLMGGADAEKGGIGRICLTDRGAVPPLRPARRKAMPVPRLSASCSAATRCRTPWATECRGRSGIC